MLARDWEVSWKYTAVSGFVRRVEIRREVRACADCNTRASAPLPPMPWVNSQFTPAMLAMVVYMKFALGVPLDRLFQGLCRQGVNVPWSTMVYMVERAFQAHAKLRVASEFAGSTEGAHRWATLLGVVNTAKRLDVDILAYLTWAIERLGTWKKVFNLPASALTPEAYKQAVAERVAA